jgi:hypothetical protein
LFVFEILSPSAGRIDRLIKLRSVTVELDRLATALGAPST